MTREVRESVQGGGSAGREIEAIYPLSPAQQGILFHSVYSDDARSYHCRALYRLRGPLQFSALRRAFERLVGRHEALRAAFLWQEAERAVQVVLRADRAPLPFEEEDWSGLAAAERRDGTFKLFLHVNERVDH